MTTKNDKPVETIRDGVLKAAVWRNQSEKGFFYSVEVVRTYKDEAGNFRDSHSFVGADSLIAAELFRRAYHKASQLRAADRLAAKQAETV